MPDPAAFESEFVGYAGDELALGYGGHDGGEGNGLRDVFSEIIRRAICRAKIVLIPDV